MDDFYYEESNPKQVFFKCLIILLIIGMCIGAFIFYKNKNTIKLKDITIELGSELSTNVLDYLENGEKFFSDYKLYLDEVNTGKVGKYTYKVKYNKHSVEGKIIVKDTIKPVIEVENIIVGVNEDIKAMYLVSSCIDLSLPCSAVFEDESILEKIKTPGKYEVVIKVSDANGNSVSKKSFITSSENSNFSSVMTSDLNYYTNSLNDGTLKDIFFVKLDSAIDEDTLEFEKLIQTISAENFEEYTIDEISDIKLVTAYNKYGYVIGVQVLAVYVDGNRELLTNIRGEE